MKSLTLQLFAKSPHLRIPLAIRFVLVHAPERPLRAVLSPPLFSGHRLRRFYKRVGLVGVFLRRLHTL